MCVYEGIESKELVFIYVETAINFPFNRVANLELLAVLFEEIACAPCLSVSLTLSTR